MSRPKGAGKGAGFTRRRQLRLGAGLAGLAGAGASPLLAACGGGAETKPLAGNVRAVNLDFLFADGPPQKQKLESVVDSFKAKYPGSQINAVFSPWGEFETKIIALYTAGTPPDFHQIDDDAVPYFAMRDLTLPVDNVLKNHAVNKAEYHKIVWDLTTVQGKVMALTLAVKPRAYVYNVDLFERAGIKAPTTWAEAWTADQLLDAARKLTRDGVFGFGWDYWIWDSIPAMNGGTHFPADWSEYLEPKYADVYQWIADLAYRHQVSAYPNPSFTNGKLAIVNGIVSSTKGWNDAPGLRWDVMPVAKLTKSAMAEASLFTFAVAKPSKDPDGTAMFASYWMGDEAQTILATGGDLMPTKTSIQQSKVFSDPDRQPKHVKLWIDSLDYQGRWPFLYNGIELRDAIKPAVDAIWTGQKPARVALEEVRPQVVDLLRISREKMGKK